MTPAIVEELRALTAQHGGTLRPRDVLDRARDPDNVLHPLFTWDDTTAAELRRLDEARGVIMRVRVWVQPRPDKPAVQVRAFTSLATDRVSGLGYRPIEAVITDPVQRVALLRTALAELHSLQRRYAILVELADVFAAVERVTGVAVTSAEAAL